MAGVHAGEHGYLVDGALELIGGHGVDFGPGHDHVAAPQDADLLGDGAGSHLVVARDHHGAYLRLSALGHSVKDLGAGRVDHANHAHKDHVALRVGAVAGVFAGGKAQHPQSGACHLLV